MTRMIRMTAGEILLCNGSARPFASIGQMLQIIAEEYEDIGVESITVSGTDENGESYRMSLVHDPYTTKNAPSENSILIEKTQQRLLGGILLRAGVVTPAQLKEAIEEQQRTGDRKRLGELLILKGFCTPGAVLDALTKQLGL